MPLVNEANLGSPENFKNNQSTNTFNQNQGFKSNGANFNQNFNQTNQSTEQPKGLFTLPPALMQIIP
jgi:hypothetical protein